MTLRNESVALWFELASVSVAARALRLNSCQMSSEEKDRTTCPVLSSGLLTYTWLLFSRAALIFMVQPLTRHYCFLSCMLELSDQFSLGKMK